MDYGEADRILTVFTREQGKVRAIAKGVRRVTSRLAGHLEPFTLIDMLLASGRELDVVSQADTVAAFRRVRENVMVTTHAYYLCELTDLLTEDRQANFALFSALVQAFAALDEEIDSRIVVLRFLVNALQALGYRPELTECLSCRRPIEPGANRFSPVLGGIVCPACARSEPSSRPITTDALKVLRHFQRTPEGPYISVPEPVAIEAERTMRDYTERIVERRFRTPSLITTVREAAAGEA
jgi:DNA repair protein RecO (recombination protein O)